MSKWQTVGFWKSKTGIMIGIVFALMVSITMVYTNCGRAQLGGYSQNSDGNEGGQSTQIGAGSCPVGQVAIGISSEKTVICVNTRNSTQAACPVNSSLYEYLNNIAYCVTNTSWDTPGSICPVGKYLLSYSNSGSILCVGPQGPQPPGPTPPGPTPVSLTCPAGQYVSGIVNGVPVCTPLPVTNPTAFVCQTGQYLADLTTVNGARNAVCQNVPWSTGPTAGNPGVLCPDGSFAIGYLSGNLVCERSQFPATTTVACAPGKILVGLDSSGAAVCSSPPNPDLSHACSSGTKPYGVKDGRVLCDDIKSTDQTICPSGQFVVKVEAGVPTCAVVPANSLPGICPVESYPIGVSNGALVCIPYDTKTKRPTRVCAPQSQVSCALVGGTGLKTCAADGMSYSSCMAISCNAGYNIDNGSCSALSCVPGSSQSCTVPNGSGSQYCGTMGTWGACQVSSCSSGYVLSNNSCVTLACLPGSTKTCSNGPAYGTQTCAGNGLSYGSCVISSCQNGYTLTNGVCVDTSAPRITFTSAPSSPTPGNSAKLVFAVIDNESGVASVSCFLDNAPYTPCSSPVQLTNLAGGIHKFTVKATDTTGNSASASAEWTNDACVPNTIRQCTVANGSGSQFCSAEGVYNACLPQSCHAGYELTTGGCVALQCGPGYSVDGNRCVDNIAPVLTISEKPQDPTIGTSATVKFSAVDQGTGVSQIACKLDEAAGAACQSPFNLNNLSVGKHVLTIVAVDGNGNKDQKKVEWNQYRCVPGAVNSCTIMNGSGQQTCSADGSGYGSCVAKECNAGYTASNGSCADVSAPVLTITKAPSGSSQNPNVTIEFTVSDAGSGLAGVTCALDKGEPKACSGAVQYSNLGPGNHSATIVANDKSGNKVTKIVTWGVQACAPNTTMACSTENGGTGTRTCAADGLSVGSCMVTKCGIGFALENQACVVNPKKDVHRFLGKNKEHFYTLSRSEGDSLSSFYKYEGVRFQVYEKKTPDTITIYRCFIKNYMHFMSTDPKCEGSANTIMEGPYGEIYRDAQPGLKALSRYWGGPTSSASGDHLMTTDPASEPISQMGYKLEGVVGYVPTP